MPMRMRLMRRLIILCLYLGIDTKCRDTVLMTTLMNTQSAVRTYMFRLCTPAFNEEVVLQ